MTLRLEMLQVARLAPKALGASADLVETFVRAQWNTDGGVRDRAGVSDLYYTVFGLECLAALQRPLPRDTVRRWLAGFANGDGLDLVHRCCLARCWTIVDPGGLDAGVRTAIAAGIVAHRSADGGFAPRPGEATGTAYSAFLALGSLQDLGLSVERADDLLASVAAARASDGGTGNHPGVPQGSTPATVSAILVRHALGAGRDRGAADWLLARQHPAGGFVAGPGVPIPDLLSTATALHALSCSEVVLPAERVEAHLDFVDTLWTAQGSFHGHWAEDVLDCEYTYYGLLALGHLSV